MAREYARVKVSIWADTDFRLLTDSAQALYFRLLSSPTMNLCGVADWRPNRLAALTRGMTPKAVRTAAEELADKGYVVVDEETEEILIRSFIRHDGLIKTPNIAAAMAKDYAGTASAVLRGSIVHELIRLKADDPKMKGWSVASHLLSEPEINPSENPSPKASCMPSANGSLKALPNGSPNGSDIPHPSSLIPHPSERVRDASRFDEFWAVYPNKKGKAAARKNWDRIIRSGVDPEAVIAGANAYAASVHGVEVGKIKYPQGWLTDGRWEDELVDPEEDRIDKAKRLGIPEAWI